MLSISERGKLKKTRTAEVKNEKVRSNLARLFLIANLLYQSRYGLTYDEIADECKVVSKTIRRDMLLLEDAGFPVWKDQGRVGMAAGNARPPVFLTTPQAVTIFIASRLLLSYGNAQNPAISSTLKILSSVVPESLRTQIFRTIEWMQNQNKDERFVTNLEKLAQAWIDSRRVNIAYKKINSNKVEHRDVDVYFIQPSVRDHGNYVIAYCHTAKDIRIFKIERIQSVMHSREKYKIPPDFDANQYLHTAWGITPSGKVETVNLKFAKDIAQIARETQWHSSQKNKEQNDGSVIVSFKLALSPDFEGFILSWGEKVQVLHPAGLRQKILRSARAIQKVYQK